MALNITLTAGPSSRTAKLHDCATAALGLAFITSLDNYVEAAISKANVTTSVPVDITGVGTLIAGASVLARIVINFDYQRAANGEVEHGQFTVFSPDKLNLEVSDILGMALKADAIQTIITAIKTACAYNTCTFTSQRYLLKSSSH